MSEPGKIDFERLLDWVEGHLSEGESRAVEEQLAAADEATRADAAWLQAFVRLSKDLVLGSPPPEVHDKLVKLFEARAKRRQRPTPRSAYWRGSLSTVPANRRLPCGRPGPRDRCGNSCTPRARPMSP